MRSASLAAAIEDVALGWQVYLLRHSTWDLGLVGLVLFLPAILFAIPAGVLADRIDRRRIMIFCYAVHGLGLGAVALLAASGTRAPTPYFVAIAVIGTAGAWRSPAIRSLLPTIVAREHYVRASSFSSATAQVTNVLGPAIGGALIAIRTPLAFGFAGVLEFVAFAACFGLPIVRPHRHGSTGVVDDERAGLRYALEGVAYISRTPVVLGAITLDLFAVLFGGATALLPVYAVTILHAGASGLGWLRAAMPVGAGVVGVWISRHPVERRAGPLLFGVVAGFGIATIVFAYSRVFWLSFLALAIAGGFDMVSMVIRSALVTLGTPDRLRGRVSAVENVFIGASNELGAFESGTAASLLGTVPSVALGGLATLVVIVIAYTRFGALRRYDRLVEPRLDAIDARPDPLPAARPSIP